jgi:PAS domain S-box-containing protein
LDQLTNARSPAAPSPTVTASRFSALIDLIRLFPRQLRQALGAKGVAWASAAGIVGLICGAAGFYEIAVSLRPDEVFRSRDETAKIGALDHALDESYRALAQAMVATGSNEGPFPIRDAWARLTEAMTTGCSESYNSQALKERLGRLCESFAGVRDRVGRELEALNPPGRPLDPSISRDLIELGRDISETTELVGPLTTDIFETTAEHYRVAIFVLTLSTTGFLATSLVLIFLVGRGSILHFKQCQNAASAVRQASEARDLLDETIEALPAGVVLYDAEDRILLFNSVAASVSPVLNRPDVIGTTFAALASETGKIRDAAGLGPSDKMVAAQITRFASKGNRGLRRLPDGRWFDNYEKSTRSGHTVGLRVDITEIKTHELEIEQARAEYQSLVDSLSDVVFAVDIKGAFTFVSAAVADLVGTPASQMIGRRFRDYVDPEDQDELIAAGRELVRSSSEDVQQLHLRLMSAEGRCRHVEIRMRNTSAGGTQNSVISGVIRDVEERVQLTRRLGEEMTRLRSIVESSGALILMADRNLRIVMVNSEFTAVSGVRDVDAVGRPLKDVINCPIDPAVVARWLEGPLEPGRAEPVRFTNTLTDPAGRQRIINVTATPVTDADRIVRKIVFLGVDDTARRDAERQLLDAERMKGIGEMAATMAHELNQPLQVVSMAAEAAAEEIDAAATGGPALDIGFVQGKLKRVLAQVDRASRLIKEVRAQARDTSTEEAVAFDLAAAVRGAVDLTEHQARLSGITMAVEVPDDLPPVFGLVSRLEQVLINLINNARDALGELHGAGQKRLIRISAESMSRDGRDFLQLAVEDTGPGIADHVLKRMFEPFLTTKPRGKGTGLGLPLCRRIVMDMDGTITARNLAAGGARFEITLPAAAEDAADLPIAPHAPPPLGEEVGQAG